ncbi:MAG: hypothetical protein IPJ98_10980 [Bryobacterales bacterium]|nr:hypothetical protein [Bryobacterales bacterium]
MKWDLLSYDYCKRDTDPGYPLDYNFYNGDCFVAAIADQPYDELRWSWPANEITFYPYSANITAHPGFVSLEGRVDKPPNEGPYQGRQFDSRSSIVQRSVPGSPAEGRILSVVQDSEYRPELPTFPSWGTVTIKVK